MGGFWVIMVEELISNEKCLREKLLFPSMTGNHIDQIPRKIHNPNFTFPMA